MASSLASQLGGIRSLNAARLTSASSLSTHSSYLFPPSTASKQDLDSIFSLGQSGWTDLCLEDASLERSTAAQTLFSPSAKTTDRTMLPKEDNANLDAAIQDFFDRVGAVLLGKSAAKCIEWLVRRFRIQDFNAMTVLRAFLPFHSTPQFARILNILSISKESHLAFLLPIQKAAQPLPTSVLLSALLAPATSSHSLDALRLVAGVLPTDREPHRAQVLFWSSTLVQFCARAAGAEAGSNGLIGITKKKARVSTQAREDNDHLVLGLLLPAVAKVITSTSLGLDAQLAGCLVLCSIAASFDLSVKAAQSIIATIVPVVAEPKADARLVQAIVTTLATFCAGGDVSQQPLPLATVQQLLSIPNFTQQVQAMSRQYDLRGLLSALLPSMAKSVVDDDDEKMATALVDLLATSPSEGGVPTSEAVEVLRPVATTASHSSAPRMAISGIRTRRSDAFDALVRDLSQNEESRHLVAPLLQAVFNGNGSQCSSASWLAINSSEASQRLASLDALLDSIAAKQVDAKDSFVTEALSARLLDDDEGVLAVLYSEKGVAAIKQSLDEATMLSKIEAVLGPTSKLPRTALQAHLAFVLSNVLGPKSANRILRNVLWPRLLITKSSRKASETVHQVLRKTSLQSLQPLQALLSGVVVQSGAHERSIAETNRAIAQGLAAAMAGVDSESHFSAHLSFLIGQATSTEIPHASATLALATLAELLPLLDAQRFNSLAQRLLDALPAAALAAEAGTLSFEGGVSDKLWQKVYEELPQSTRLSTSQTVLAVAQCLQFISTSLVGLEASEASPAVGLAQRLYGIASSTDIGRDLFVVLFKKLGPSTPTFLARLWTSEVATSSRLTSLRHCQAFLAAHRGQAGMDFQLLVPALIVALCDADASIRSEALKCLNVVAEAASSEGEATTIWGYDAVYGEASDKVRYLDTSALRQLASGITEESEAIINDASYLFVLLPNLLTPQKGQEKRKVNMQRSTTSYLLSHVVAWPSFKSKLALLRATAGLRDSAKLPPLLPLLSDTVAAGQASSLNGFFAGQLDASERDDFVRLLFEAVDKRAKATLEDSESGAWALVAKGLSSPTSVVAKCAALSLKTVFGSISSMRRREAVERLTNTLVHPTVQAPKELRETLGQLDIDVDILVSLLVSLRQDISERALGSPMAKKSRTDASRAQDGASSSAANLSELLEALLQRRLAISPALIVELFEVLRTATELYTTGNASGDYLLHLTLSNLYNVLQSATPTTDVVQSLRVDTVVNVIKASSNPSTFQQALLLLSAIAGLAPETVLHSAMPIFTFVGSSVLQRDDAFSFTVVERVLRSIVPPLVKSLKAQSGQDGFALLKLARPFLCIFTDSATHIPRHRRSNFFQLLVEVLGPVDFTSAISMLLVDRSAHKIVRQQGASSQSLQLPLSILVSQSASTQLKSFVSIYAEIERLLATREADATQAEQLVFLDRLSRVSSEHSDKQIDATVQVQALLALLQAAIASPQFSLKASRSSDDGNRTLYHQVVEASLRVASFDDEDVSSAANAVLASIMALVPVETFASIVEKLTGDASTDAELRDSGFELIAVRLSSLSPSEREHFANSTPAIVKSAAQLLSSNAATPAVLSSLQAIAATCLAGEHSGLSPLVPQMLALVESASASVSEKKAAFSIIRSLSAVLGPRLLSHLKRVVDAAISTAQRPAASSLRTLALETLNKLFSSVSSFMETHIPPVIAMSTDEELQDVVNEDSSRGAGRALVSLLSTLIKVSPSDKVFNSTFAVWDAATSSTATQIGALDFLQRALRLADRSAVASNYKGIFRFILRVLDQRRTKPDMPLDAIVAVENAAVRAFVRLVLKLNETTFRPLFLRIYDWAALDLAEDDMPLSNRDLVCRRIALYKVSNALHEQLRGLISHYYATMLDLVIELLDGYRSSKLDDAELWSAVMTSIDKSARYDEGTFWNPKRLEKLSPAFIGQLAMRNSALVANVGGAEAVRDAVSPAVVSLARTVPDEGSLKVLNSALLTPLRIDDGAVRSSTLAVLTALWSESSLSSVLLGLVPETVPHIAELMESDEEEVVAATREFIGAVEAVLGEPLDAYLQ